MKTSEIINTVCSHLGIAKADLAKRMGLYPSSLYRKLSKGSMTFEELQKCLDVLGVSVEMQFQYPDGDVLNSKANHEQLVDRMDILEGTGGREKSRRVSQKIPAGYTNRTEQRGRICGALQEARSPDGSIFG